MAAPITRLRYPSYRGKESEDPDSFIEEFEQIARANREAHNDDKLRIFPALLKGRGSRWAAALDPADLATWDTLKKAFLAEFRSLGFNKTVYNRLATLERRRKESLRILGPQSTMAEVISTAEKYETARRTAKKKKKLKSHRAMSSSSDDDSGTSSESSSKDEENTRRHKGKKKVKRRSSSTDESSSSEEEEKPKRVTSPKRRVKAGKSSMDALLREMADLKVQIANVKEKRKNPSAPRHNLWCSNCHSNGHTKDECKMAKGSGNQVNWVEESTPSTDESYYDEGADGLVHHISLSNGNTGPQFSAPRYNPPEFVKPQQYNRTPNINRMTVPIPASEVITIPSSLEGWPSDSAWDTFGVSTRSRGETKTPSTKEEKKKKGKKQVEVSVETSSGSDSETVKRDLYKDDISSIIREALKKQSPGNIDATPSTEVRPILEASTLPSDVSRTGTISLSTKLDYDFVKNLSET
ncbi:hypothetical protein R1sor_008513 [Riccia sorocarpa]|uniref:Retrotransposon gag domain-containing protein n=1 Tax=Riccia sorocarpa TaxID=122646 RepID=A0ABD3HTN9_9MARC